MVVRFNHHRKHTRNKMVVRFNHHRKHTRNKMVVVTAAVLMRTSKLSRAYSAYVRTDIQLTSVAPGTEAQVTNPQHRIAIASP
jgi:hypothetical protein